MSGHQKEPNETEVTSQDIETVMTSMVGRFDAELLATPESELDKRWQFRWNEGASVEWNLYKFNGALESFKRNCRRWEEHHNGSSCVVERVRDKYLMPKIREFMAELATHKDNAQGREPHRGESYPGETGSAAG